MKYEIEYNNKEERFYLFEFVGDEPIRYECKLGGWCVDEQGYCPMCGHGVNILIKLEGWEEWKIKYLSRKKIPCAKKYNDYFSNLRLNKSNIDSNYYGMLNGEAVPKQLNLFN